MALIKKSQWKPIGVKDLEPTAFDVVRSSSNTLVAAGPGAGKTELLAQRAAFLLQTGESQDPMRILAISFKRDAAANLRDRVHLRCGRALSARFDSHTFDSFAMGLVERFRDGLTHEYRPNLAFKCADTNQEREDVERLIERSLRVLTPPPELPARRVVTQPSGGTFNKRHLCLRPLSAFGSVTTAAEWAAPLVWQRLLRQSPCVITFDMMKRLAQHIVESNPLLRRALVQTYSHVFLDEFQDVTGIQYQLVAACLASKRVAFTAVGDDKQRIMLWANALPDAFQRFAADYAAVRVTLVRNYRSHADLVSIQRIIARDLETDAPGDALPAPSHTSRCRLLRFDNQVDEATYLASLINDSINAGIRPRDICLLSRITPATYLRNTMDLLGARGIRSRLEEEYQDLTRDELVRAIIAVLEITVRQQAPDAYDRVLDLLSRGAGADGTSERPWRTEERLALFLRDFRRRLGIRPPSDKREMTGLLQQIIERFGGAAALAGLFPEHANSVTFKSTMGQLRDRLLDAASNASNWRALLDDFAGGETIPAMTIHKSKGLEFRTVIFVGLEDHAWARFSELGLEERCAFFVAFSRAKEQVVFTSSAERATSGEAFTSQSRHRVSSLLELLASAGIAEESPPAVAN